MTILSAAILLFFVMDPLGNIPMFLIALREVEPARRRVVAKHAGTRPAPTFGGGHRRGFRFRL